MCSSDLAFATVMPSPRPVEPSWLRPSLDALPEGTPVVTDIPYGSYLTWAYPRIDAVFNGYADAYTDAELTEEFTVLDLLPGWEEVLQRHDLTYALLRPDTPLAYALRHLAGWQVVHHTADIELLHRPDAG